MRVNNGQQIILATHDYVLLKWFDLLMDKGKGDQVRFHVLSREAESGQVRRDSMDDYRAIEPNAIADTAIDHRAEPAIANRQGFHPDLRRLPVPELQVVRCRRHGLRPALRRHA